MPKNIARAAIDAFAARETGSGTMGITITEVGRGEIEATMTMTADHLNGHGSGHGGAISYLAITAFGYAANTSNRKGFGHTAGITFVAPVQEGDHLRAVAKELHATGRTAQIDVTIYNQNNEIVALFRGGAHLSKERWIDVE